MTVADLSDLRVQYYVQQLGPILKNFHSEDKHESILTPEYLARFIHAFQRGMDLHLGKDSPSPRPFPKLPQRLLEDFSPSGALFHLAKLAVLHTEADVMERREEFLAFIKEYRETLLQSGLLRLPLVSVSPLCGELTTQSIQALQSMGIRIAAGSAAEGVTHIVNPFDPIHPPPDSPSPPPTGPAVTMRLKEEVGIARVHVRHTPESFDTYAAAEGAPPPAEDFKEFGPPFSVGPRWALDSFFYNELMAEVDYVCAEEGAAKPQDDLPPVPLTAAQSEHAARQRRMHAPADVAPKAGVRMRIGGGLSLTLPEVLGERAVRVGAGVVKHTIGGLHHTVTEGSLRPENLSRGQIGAAPPLAARGLALGEPSSSQPPFTGPSVRLPAHSAWYDPLALHAVERRHLDPRLLDGTLLSETRYREIRNALVAAFRADPSRPLPPAALEEPTSLGPLMAFRFLEEWGLINYMPERRALPKPLPPPAAPAAAEEGDVAPAKKAKVDPPPPIALPSDLGRVERVAEFPPFCDKISRQILTNTGRKEVTVSLPDYYLYDRPPAARYYCHATGEECSGLRFACTRLPDVVLSPAAFARGLLPRGVASSDFIRVEAESESRAAGGGARAEARDESGGVWTEEETGLLLEALERHPGQWERVAQHVATKSQLHCMTHFLQLPIEEAILQQEIRARRAAAAASLELPPGAPPGPLPLPLDLLPMARAEIANPLMTLLALLSASISPLVATAAARAALEHLTGGKDGGPPPSLGHPLTREDVTAAARAALQAAAVRAKELALAEEAAMRRAVRALADLQLERVERKASRCEAIATLVRTSRGSTGAALAQSLAGWLAHIKAESNKPEVAPFIAAAHASGIADPALAKTQALLLFQTRAHQSKVSAQLHSAYQQALLKLQVAPHNVEFQRSVQAIQAQAQALGVRLPAAPVLGGGAGAGAAHKSEME